MLRWFKARVIVCNCKPHAAKHAVVTGATSGIGRATALELARHGWTITLACRNLEVAAYVKKEIVVLTGNSNIDIRKLDLTERSSIDSFVTSLDDANVDVLINNAGVMASSARPVHSFGGVDVNVATNYLGTFYLTYTMLSRGKMSPYSHSAYPRIITVSSSLSSKGKVDGILMPWKANAPWNTTVAYANSKLACCLLSRELHRRFGSAEKKMVSVYCLFTGGMVNTNLNRELILRYPLVIQGLWRLASRVLLKSPFEGCQSVVHCAVSPDVPGAHHTHALPAIYDQSDGSGLLYRNCIPIPWPPFVDTQKATFLWQETMQLLRLDDR